MPASFACRDFPRRGGCQQRVCAAAEVTGRPTADLEQTVLILKEVHRTYTARLVQLSGESLIPPQ
jgi:hypothetical protein